MGETSVVMNNIAINFRSHFGINRERSSTRYMIVIVKQRGKKIRVLSIRSIIILFYECAENM